MPTFITIVLCTLLNRFRGTAQSLPGRPLFYAAPMLSVIALIHQPLPVAICFGIAYFVWAVGPWGRWYDLHHADKWEYARKPPTKYEQFVESLSCGDDYIAFFIRQLNAVPGMLLLLYMTGNPMFLTAAVLFPLLVLSIYFIAWSLSSDTHAIRNAEYMTGALWGTLIVM